MRCQFGEPAVSGDVAAVEWWSSWLEGDKEVTLAGVTLLAFDADGLIRDHRDYPNQHDGRVDPYAECDRRESTEA